MKDAHAGAFTSSLTQQALGSTQQLLMSTTVSDESAWLEAADDQFALVLPDRVLYSSDADQLRSGISFTCRLFNNIRETDALQLYVHPINDETRCVIVSNTQLKTDLDLQDSGPLGALPSDQPSAQTNPVSFRCSLVWTMRNDQLKLSQCFVNVSSFAPYRRRQNTPAGTPLPQSTRTAANSLSPRFQIMTSDGGTHWVEQDEIVYVQAKRQYTEVHCKRRVLRTHALLKDVLKKLGNAVVRVHRSYAVNPRYIHSLRGEMLYLTTDEKIPVPARRIKEIRDLLSDTL